MPEPFAIQIYRRYASGETIEYIAEELGIPVERVEIRIRAAVLYLERQRRAA